MVRGDQQPVIALALQEPVQWSDDRLVDSFQGLDLLPGVAFVRGLVRCLDMDDNQVVI